MKTRIAVVAVALSFVTAAACFAANPHMGTWKFNEAKSKMPAGMGKNTTVVYAEQGDKIKVTVDGVDKDGKPTHSVWVGKFDGKAYPSKGNLSWNSAAYKVVNDRTNDITTMKDGKIVWSGKITVAADGKSRTVTINGTDANGKKFKGKAVQRPAKSGL
jgi:lipopolysaccharide export LptBFGC system permease protein LptF